MSSSSDVMFALVTNRNITYPPITTTAPNSRLTRPGADLELETTALSHEHTPSVDPVSQNCTVLRIMEQDGIDWEQVCKRYSPMPLRYPAIFCPTRTPR
uniref:Uncharacterized protein n=1 Tax=Knipowitschia caucasica TaxID=637954 RepID=A0AAV2LFL6_KNICA